MNHRKSTLLLQVAAMLSADAAAEEAGPDSEAALNGGESEVALNGADSKPDQEEQLPAAGEAVLYVSAEESVEQV